MFSRRFLTSAVAHCNAPLIVGGDLNTVLDTEDRLHGHPVSQSEIYDFDNCLHENELTEIRAVGGYSTWCNNQEGEDRISSKIDRVTANSAWFQLFPNVIVEVQEKGVSDHCPLLLDFGGYDVKRKTPFRFLNVLAGHDQFLGLVTQTWTSLCHSDPLLDIWLKLKRTSKGAEYYSLC